MTAKDGPGGGLFVVLDIEGRHLFASPALHDFTGRPRGSIVSSTWLELTHPDDLDHARGFCHEAFRDRRSFAGWWRLLRHDGVFVWAMMGGTPMSSQLSDAPTAYMVAIDPLAQLDAFRRAGGVIGPDRPLEGEPRSRLSRVERLADLALMASALARESGEAEIASAFDAPLERIGFRLARLSEAPQPPHPASVGVSEGYRRPPRQVRTLRRRLTSRG